jgi:hypothetical protein
MLMDGKYTAPKRYDDEAKKYLTVEFQQSNWDYGVNPPVVGNRVSHGVRGCTEEDMRTKQMRDIFVKFRDQARVDI